MAHAIEEKQTVDLEGDCKHKIKEVEADKYGMKGGEGRKHEKSSEALKKR